MAVEGRPEAADSPQLSIVVVCYNMRREIARTLHSLSAQYQQGIERGAYEVILVDNGSAEPPTAADFFDLDLDLRILHQPDPTPSPVAALNRGIAACRGPLIGCMIDGARMASPGLLATALRASRLHDRAIIFTQSLTLGHGLQWIIAGQGYDRHVEDRLLESIGWPEDGYRLFEIATWPSPHADERRWSTPLYESNALFMPTALWEETGGYDTAFTTPGGGTASADLFLRATELDETQLVVLTGEATFHQIHTGSISTNSPNAANNLKSFSREYHHVRGRALRPARCGFWTFGHAHPAAHLAPAPATPAVPAGRLYIDLLKQTLLNEQGLELEAAHLALQEQLAEGCAETPAIEPRRLKRALKRLTEARKLGVSLNTVPSAYTMIGGRRLDNLDACIAEVIDDGIPGDFIECGVWRGGACVLMRGILQARGIRDRTIWVADSFAGLPPPAPDTDENADFTAAVYPDLAISQAEVAGNFDRFGLLDDQVRFLVGWFKDTLPEAPIDRLAILRADGDLYSSTMDVLSNLYDKVSSGGYVIIDDYGAIAQCARAVDDFRAARGITASIRRIDWTGVCWRKD